MEEALAAIRAELEALGDEAVRKSVQRFSREEIRCYGVQSAAVRRIAAREYKKIKGLPRGDIFALCTGLWESAMQEEILVACAWAERLAAFYEEGDLALFYRWIEGWVSNWASCDTLCTHTVGLFLEKFPTHVQDLKGWAVSPNRWVRRASAVSLIIPAKGGLFQGDIFEIADILLEDQDDLVQKGYGWMLKAAADADREAVFDFVMARRSRMPRTALRYAIEKMPPELKNQARQRIS
jgi:3-methyladenine DNA glycosylase AlkD